MRKSSWKDFLRLKKNCTYCWIFFRFWYSKITWNTYDNTLYNIWYKKCCITLYNICLWLEACHNPIIFTFFHIRNLQVYINLHDPAPLYQQFTLTYTPTSHSSLPSHYPRPTPSHRALIFLAAAAAHSPRKKQKKSGRFHRLRLVSHGARAPVPIPTRSLSRSEGFAPKNSASSIPLFLRPTRARSKILSTSFSRGPARDALYLLPIGPFSFARARVAFRSRGVPKERTNARKKSRNVSREPIDIYIRLCCYDRAAGARSLFFREG